MTLEDYCISLNPNIFFLVVLGVVDMCHDLLNAVSIYNFYGWLMPPVHIKKMSAILLLLLITFTSLSYSDYQLVNFVYSEFHP